MTPTLYLTRNGLLEPLWQSQVFAYLRGLSRDYRITLITYWKDMVRANSSRLAPLQAECDRLGIRWLPQRFRHQPGIIAPASSMLGVVWPVRAGARGQGARLVHGRSHIPAVVVLIVGRLTGAPLIFDSRPLWPEELITAGRLRRGSLLYRAIVAAERTWLRQTRAVASLTHSAVEHRRRVYPDGIAGKRVGVIPMCAHPTRFTPAATRPDRVIIGCLGTVLSGCFRLDWLADVLTVMARRVSNAVFELTTKDDPARVQAALDPSGQLGDRLHISGVGPGNVQLVLQQQTASAIFFSEGLSNLGSSPTRMAETPGFGLPVVVSDGVGDVTLVIRDYRVDVLAEGSAGVWMEAACDRLLALSTDPILARAAGRQQKRCSPSKPGPRLMRTFTRASCNGPTYPPSSGRG